MGVAARLAVELQDTLPFVAVAVYLGVDNLVVVVVVVVVVVEAALAADSVLAVYEALPCCHFVGVRVGVVVLQGPAAAPRACILSRHETLLLSPYYFLPKFALIMQVIPNI